MLLGPHSPAAVLVQSLASALSVVPRGLRVVLQTQSVVLVQPVGPMDWCLGFAPPAVVVLRPHSAPATSPALRLSCSSRCKSQR